MIQGIKNIKSVSKYETKLLLRSWFFKIFAALAIIVSTIMTIVLLFFSNSIEIIAINSIVPYMVALILNVGQAVVSIFLSSEYLKRDKQLDTSEVFYVRSLSNAEYLLGKMWGTLRVFFSLNFIVLGIVYIISLVKFGVESDLISYFLYFILLSVPTLVFITGLSTTLMLVIKNQALTFVFLLAYIGITLFYIDDIYYYLFDYIGFNLPMLKSTMTGFGDLIPLIVHRSCYLLLGIGFVLSSILLFRRLPNSRFSLLPWRILSALFLAAGLFAGYIHVSRFTEKKNYQARMIELNNLHVNDAKVVVDTCRLDVLQLEDKIRVKAVMDIVPLRQSAEFTFCLNPGFKIDKLMSDGESLVFRREEQLIFIDFGREVAVGEHISLVMEYSGRVDERICYIDIPDEVELANVKAFGMLNTGKRYSFHTPDYVLLTPETYWYPRPGVCYSDESPDWQQSYFTHYKTTVTTKEGLTSVSQGERRASDDGLVVSYASELPMQSVSLMIGKYVSRAIEVDSTTYSIWYIDGHDFFTEFFDTISDTIPEIVREVRRTYEYNIGLDYPFKRFSLVEVPVHFATYPRAWTQAQETMQPEMVLMPEKAYGYYSFNFEEKFKNFSNRRYYSNSSRNNDMTEKDIKISILKSALLFMNNKVSDYNFDRGKLGRATVTTTDNPRYIFPQMYNFRYNVYSNKWPIANRMIELFLQGNNANQNTWIRQQNGLSNDEKALLLMQRYSFKELQSDVDHLYLMNSFINLKASYLFAESQHNIGIEAFRDSLFNIVKESEFTNISFEHLLDTMGKLSNTDLILPLNEWDKPVALPKYAIGTPQVTNVVTRENDIFQAEIVIGNLSNVAGYISFGLQFYNSGQSVMGSDKPTEWIIRFEPNQTKRIVSHWEETPSSFNINTLISGNLPVMVRSQAGNIVTGSTLIPEGEYVVSGDVLIDQGEIIVDNEDETLFELSPPLPSGYLNTWIDNSMSDEEFKYIGLDEWRAPFRWTAATDGNFYGQSVRSAYIIRSGDGSQYAKWRVPTDGPGTYDVYYYVRKTNQVSNRNNNRRGNSRRDNYFYYFTIEQPNYSEEASIELSRVNNGWTELGTFRIDADTVNVILSNRTGLNMVIADAVKFVKRVR